MGSRMEDLRITSQSVRAIREEPSSRSTTTTSGEWLIHLAESIKTKSSSRVEQCTKASGLTLCAMDKANRSGLILPATKVSGERERQTEPVSSSTPMVIFMKESGSMIRLTAKAPTHTLTEPNMLVNGEMINSMDRALRPGLIVPSTKDNISKERRTAPASLLSLTHPSTRVSFK